MYQKSNVYTPQISQSAAFLLRRIAWGLGRPMTKTLNHAINALVPSLKHEVVCGACKDRQCSECQIAAYVTLHPAAVQSAVADSVEDYGM